MTRASGRRGSAAALCALALLALPQPLQAGSGLADLSPRDEAILRAMLVEVLSGLPDLLPPVTPGATTGLSREVADDLARIDALSDRLFGPGLPGFGAPDAARTIAFLTAADCPDCARAEAELRELAQEYDLRVRVIDVTEAPDIPLALDLDMVPSYVFERMMLRGAMPKVVLQRYLK